MSKNVFFKATPLYREFMILDTIEKNKFTTQRELSNEVGIVTSMVNNYIDDFEEDYAYYLTKNHKYLGVLTESKLKKSTSIEDALIDTITIVDSTLKSI